MNRKRLISAVLVVVLAVTLAVPGAFAALQPTAWAVPEVNDASTTGVLTQAAARDYHRNLTRDEFCEIVVNMIEGILNKELPIPSANPFSDTSSVYVQKANLYGVVEGIGDGKFGPNLNVERQQIATMMIRAIKRLETDTGKSFLKSGVQMLPFYDSSKIGSYALDAVKIAYANGIMNGDDVNNFNPVAYITSQECVAVAIRCFNSIQEVLNSGRTPQQLADAAYNNLHIGFAYGDTGSGVSQNLLLATKGVGGASIYWQSSNPAVISTDGKVTAGSAAQTVTLTATITVGGITRTKSFSLNTSPYTGDRQIVESAYKELEVVYLNNDSAESVTGRICLPATVLGIPVTWSSSNPGVVSTSGAVNVPASGSATVTLTAVITKGSQTKTKYFTLNVGTSSKNISLHGVEFGMSQAQVASALGQQPKRSITTGSTESWQLFHTSYNSFIAVGYISNKVAAVYSMAPDASNRLLNSDTKAVITTAQANSISGVGVTSFTDSNDAGRQYALLAYDSTSNITARRTLTSDGAEQMMFELINAFRVKNGKTALEWNAKLGTSARAHSTDMGVYNYFSHDSRDGKQFYDRAETAGYDKSLTKAENIATGCDDAIEFLDVWVNSAGPRSNILLTELTVHGVGFYTGNTSTGTYCTQVFGILKAITGVTTNPAALGSVGVGSSLSFALVPSTGYNETFTVTSSNTNILAITSVSGTSVTVKGVAVGTANVVVTGNSSGNSYNIPVTVGTAVTANRVTANRVTANSVTASPTSVTLTLSPYSTQQITPAPVPSTATGCTYTYYSNNANVASVSGDGLITAVGEGTTTITVTLTQGSATRTTTVSVTVINSVSLTISGAASVTAGGSITFTPTVTPYLPTGYTVVWASSNTSTGGTIASSGNNGILTGITDGQTTDISATIRNASGVTVATSDTVPVTVAAALSAQPPIIINQPTANPMEITLGDSTKLSVDASVSDGGTLTYSWYRSDGSPIATTVEGFITPENIGSYSYYVTIINTKPGLAPAQTTSSHQASVTVRAAATGFESPTPSEFSHAVNSPNLPATVKVCYGSELYKDVGVSWSYYDVSAPGGPHILTGTLNDEYLTGLNSYSPQITVTVTGS